MLSKCDIYLYIFMYSFSCGTQGENWRMETKQAKQVGGQMRERSSEVDAMIFHTTSIFLQFSYRFSYDWKPLHSRHIHKKNVTREINDLGIKKERNQIKGWQYGEFQSRMNTLSRSIRRSFFDWPFWPFSDRKAKPIPAVRVK